MIHILYKLRANIHQTQLNDFIGAKRVEIYKMWDSKDYRLARKKFFWLSIRRYGKRIISIYSVRFDKYKCKIVDYLKWLPKLREKYLYRFPRIKIPRFEDYAEWIISKKEWDIFHYLPKFDGPFENLFEFNDFNFFDDLQERLEEEGGFLLRICLLQTTLEFYIHTVLIDDFRYISKCFLRTERTLLLLKKRLMSFFKCLE